jgi:hypothetical protein
MSQIAAEVRPGTLALVSRCDGENEGGHFWERLQFYEDAAAAGRPTRNH